MSEDIKEDAIEEMANSHVKKREEAADKKWEPFDLVIYKDTSRLQQWLDLAIAAREYAEAMSAWEALSLADKMKEDEIRRVDKTRNRLSYFAMHYTVAVDDVQQMKMWDEVATVNAREKKKEGNGDGT